MFKKLGKLHRMQTENNPIRERNISELSTESMMKDAFQVNVLSCGKLFHRELFEF